MIFLFLMLYAENENGKYQLRHLNVRSETNLKILTVSSSVFEM